MTRPFQAPRASVGMNDRGMTTGNPACLRRWAWMECGLIPINAFARGLNRELSSVATGVAPIHDETIPSPSRKRGDDGPRNVGQGIPPAGAGGLGWNGV